jgi:hypothetical protein
VKKHTVSGGSKVLVDEELPNIVSLSRLWLKGRSSLAIEFGNMQGRPKVMLSVLGICEYSILHTACLLTGLKSYNRTMFACVSRLRLDSVPRKPFVSVVPAGLLHGLQVHEDSKLDQISVYLDGIAP